MMDQGFSAFCEHVTVNAPKKKMSVHIALQECRITSYQKYKNVKFTGLQITGTRQSLLWPSDQQYMRHSTG
jgi:hypothetical protein